METTTTWALVEDELLDEEALVALDPPKPLVPVPEPPVVPADELDDPVEPDPLTCWPTVRFTLATVPSMVDVRVASARSVWALVSWACDESTAAWSAASWAAEAPSAWSDANFDWSRATVASAWATVACRVVSLMVASVWPAVTA